MRGLHPSFLETCEENAEQLKQVQGRALRLHKCPSSSFFAQEFTQAVFRQAEYYFEPQGSQSLSKFKLHCFLEM